MNTRLSLEPTSEGLVVRMDDNGLVPVTEWTSQATRLVGIGTLIRLRDEGRAFQGGDGDSLRVPWESVASLTAEQLKQVGLPDVSPFTLEIVANGSILDRAFDVQYGFLEKGRRVLGVQREGAWLWVAGAEYALLDPAYTIVEAVDAFNRGPEDDLESRMLRWGRIAEMLPEEVTVNQDQLRSLRIVVASSFKLDPFVNEDGEPDFDPVIGRLVTRPSGPVDEEQVFDPVLADARQAEFARQFRGLSNVKHRYAVGGGVYVVLTPDVEKVLTTVRQAQRANPEGRRDFLLNVSGYLRGALEDGPGAADLDLDEVFRDDGLSERVKGVGIWVEKALPWIKRTAEPWLPPEALGVRIGSQIIPIQAEDLLGLREAIRSAIEAKVPTVPVTESINIPANSATLDAVEELLNRLQPVQHPRKDKKRQKQDHPDTSDQVLLVIDNLDKIRFASRERKYRTPGIAAAMPALRTTLLPHQAEGLAWLQEHWDAGSWGALLADDMGLGKTLLALAFLSCLETYAREQGLKPRPMLIVAPTGLLRNWQDEHAKHLSGRGIGVALEAHGRLLRRLREGPTAKRGGELEIGQPVLDIKVLRSADWVLTTYETLRDYQHSFGRVRWRAGVFDEAQKIKNPGVRVTEAALAMEMDFALLMTGTPVENRVADIWSLLDRAEPGSFGTLKDFSERYERGAESTLAQLRRTLIRSKRDGWPALMLRRLKEDHIKKLPAKRMHRMEVEMPPLQAQEYERAVLDRAEGASALQALHRLRSISLHPRAPAGSDFDEYIRESARLSKTFEILETIAEKKEKALLFVEARQMQDFLIVALRHCFPLTEDVLVINGAVSGGTRKARVDSFQERRGFDAMILSPRAGGVGLTLTAANHVIHLSRWWNPAVEDQCTDRVFRIGQKRTVHVYLPLARHPRFNEYSFDLKLDSLMSRKRHLNREVLAATVATNRDVEDLYRSTMTDASRRAGDPAEGGRDVDLLEPEAFESWVLQQLARSGYETRLTPRTGDRGADGLAFARGGDSPHTILVQCKHTQPHLNCGRDAVEEILASLDQYDVVGEPKPMVVTNGAGFAAGANELAASKGVVLIDRSNLSQLHRWRSRGG